MDCIPFLLFKVFPTTSIQRSGVYGATLCNIRLAAAQVSGKHEWKMDLECSISVAVTLIAACTALITGFQIINFCTINRRLHKIDKLQKDTEEQLATQKNVTQESICIFNGLEIIKHGDSVLERPSLAFLQFHQALVYSIEIDRDDYDWLFDYLNRCI